MKELLTLSFFPCHRMKERSFTFSGKQFPVCARCTGILLGFVFILVLLFIPWRIPFWIGILLNIPMVIDGYTQLKKWRQSNNSLRFFTGLVSGFGLSVFVVSGSIGLGRFLLEWEF
ncbi:DUF2085 domain-containing protein [Brevibacillus choshinensis]|uniref:DUF2085 domain-containing protein n=1 Tax=Brevibacillus choshinensis TaxID=54911 RepID=UPI002E21ACB3|nr:DUF2085 domain-containing protein [Brevibacillus choshinensis]